MAWRSVVGSIIAVLMSIMDIQITNAAIGTIQAALHAPLADASWISSAYLIAEIVMLPLTGVLTRRLGYRRYASWFAVMFMLASLLCAQAVNFQMLVICRLFQGLAGGALMPLAYNLIMERIDDKDRGRAMSLFGATMTLAPMIGPVLGGIMTARFGWASIFYINLPIGATGLALMMNGLANDVPRRDTQAKVDWVGLLLVVVGLSCLQYVLEEGNQYGWLASRPIAALSAVAALALTAFVITECASRHPLVELRLLADRQLMIACSANVATGAVVYGSFFLVPYLLVEVWRYTPADISKVVFIGGIAQLVLLGFLPRILRYAHVYALVAAGAALSAMSSWIWSRLALRFDDGSMLVAQLTRGVGFGLMLTPLGVLATTSVKRDIPSASILFNMARSLGGAMGVALLTAFVGLRSRAGLIADHGTPAVAMFAFHRTFALMASCLLIMALFFTVLDVSRRVRHANRESAPLVEQRAIEES